jgi:hypothetical protein
VDVGPADGAEFHIDDDLSGSRSRVGQILDGELLVTLVDGCSHKSHSSSLGCLLFRQMIADVFGEALFLCSFLYRSYGDVLDARSGNSEFKYGSRSTSGTLRPPHPKILNWGPSLEYCADMTVHLARPWVWVLTVIR